jgi:hypothetical protein
MSKDDDKLIAWAFAAWIVIIVCVILFGPDTKAADISPCEYPVDEIAALEAVIAGLKRQLEEAK